MVKPATLPTGSDMPHHDRGLAELQQELKTTAMREYMLGWRWGVVCGLVAGASTAPLMAVLVVTALNALVPAC